MNFMVCREHEGNGDKVLCGNKDPRVSAAPKASCFHSTQKPLVRQAVLLLHNDGGDGDFKGFTA